MMYLVRYSVRYVTGVLANHLYPSFRVFEKWKDAADFCCEAVNNPAKVYPKVGNAGLTGDYRIEDVTGVTAI